ncbi:hypothetical protein [Neptuniibacter sp. QD37_11]|uniref:hypothetical protein n=1 Tax=Neptuniibacter sp. QD37_11 TaxID=3398209 RepID=UPI0039F5E26F
MISTLIEESINGLSRLDREGWLFIMNDELSDSLSHGTCVLSNVFEVPSNGDEEISTILRMRIHYKEYSPKVALKVEAVVASSLEITPEHMMGKDCIAFIQAIAESSMQLVQGALFNKGLVCDPIEFFIKTYDLDFNEINMTAVLRNESSVMSKPIADLSDNTKTSLKSSDNSGVFAA